jgi:hypothetical protein
VDERGVADGVKGGGEDARGEVAGVDEGRWRGTFVAGAVGGFGDHSLSILDCLSRWWFKRKGAGKGRRYRFRLRPLTERPKPSRLRKA